MAAVALLLLGLCGDVAADSVADSATADSAADATDTAVDIATGGQYLPRGDNGGFLELGFSSAVRRNSRAQDDPADDGELTLEVSLAASGAYRYNGFFVEGMQSSFDGLNLGLALWRNPRWSVDLLAVNFSGSVSLMDDDEPTPQTEAQRSQEVLDRNTLFMGAGFRVSGYFGPWYTQMRAVHDWFDSRGVIANGSLGRQWQRGNWNHHALIGLRYFSGRTADYLWGIDADEVTERFPRYSADSAVALEGEWGVAVPMSRRWVFRTVVRALCYEPSVSDSPLQVSDSHVLLETTLNYVF